MLLLQALHSIVAPVSGRTGYAYFPASVAALFLLVPLFFYIQGLESPWGQLCEFGMATAAQQHC
eukprot:scaffold141109_cov24-Tisochrysis_lutea.AAC.1